VSSLIHKATGRESLAGGGNQLWIYPNDKPRNWDAWDVDAAYKAEGFQLVKPESITTVEEGPHRVAIRVIHRYRDSSVTQTYSLAANGHRLDIKTDIDWHDRRTMLRTLTAVAVRTRTASFECAYGIVERTTHNNTSWDEAMFEAAAHRFIDMSEPGFGVALLNDAKYGHSAKGNVLGMSLVRGPIYPDPLADEGEQTFTYALYPHAGSWAEGGVREEAEDLNQPLVTTAVSGIAAGVSTPLNVTGYPVALSGLKGAEEGKGVILRVYEPAGGRGSLAVGAASGWKVSEPLNVMEEPWKREGSADIMPFEVRSWRIAKS
jgi:alpha-mannosidase